MSKEVEGGGGLNVYTNIGFLKTIIFDPQKKKHFLCGQDPLGDPEKKFFSLWQCHQSGNTVWRMYIMNVIIPTMKVSFSHNRTEAGISF